MSSNHSFLKVRYLFIGLILLALVVSCADNGCKEQFFDGKYEGFWAETMWTYEFKAMVNLFLRHEGTMET